MQMHERRAGKASGDRRKKNIMQLTARPLPVASGSPDALPDTLHIMNIPIAVAPVGSWRHLGAWSVCSPMRPDVGHYHAPPCAL